MNKISIAEAQGIVSQHPFFPSSFYGSWYLFPFFDEAPVRLCPDWRNVFRLYCEYPSRGIKHPLSFTRRVFKNITAPARNDCFTNNLQSSFQIQPVFGAVDNNINALWNKALNI